ncbi:hypothetical protein Tco_1222357 [Tanacetum coccineum]
MTVLSLMIKMQIIVWSTWKLKKFVQDFMPIRSERDKKMIDKMNKKAAGMDEEEVPEEPESTKVEVKQEGHDYYRVFRANGSSRYIKTFTEMVSRFDRLDFIELHSLVMQRFSTTTPEGTDLVLWGDLRIMETLERMTELRLTTESEGKAVFDLLRFIQKHIDEFGSQDGSEKDL